MARPIQYTPSPAKVGPDAYEELERLLQSAHEHGLLRFANDLISANTHWARIIVEGLNTDGARNAVQNLAALAMLLSQMEPARLYKIMFALKDAALRMEQSARDDTRPRGDEAPGVTGAYRLLHDESLWEAIAPLLDALKVFAERLNRDVDKPIFDFTGQPGGARTDE